MQVDSGTVVALLMASVLVILSLLALEILRRPRWTLIPSTLFRLGMITALFLLSRNYLQRAETVRESRDVVILRDVSASMNFSDDQAVESSRRVIGELKRLAEARPDVKLHEYRFSRQVVGADGDEDTDRADGTALGDALGMVRDEFPGSAVVLISDGNENCGFPAVLAAKCLAQSESTVYPINTGLSRKGGGDLSILSVTDPDELFVGGTLDLRGLVARRGRPIESCTITVTVDSKRALVRHLALNRPLTPFDLCVSDPRILTVGWHHVVVEIATKDKELTTLNNRFESVCLVKSKVHVTLLHKHLIPDLRFLTPTLQKRFGKSLRLVSTARLAEMSAKERAELVADSKGVVLADVRPADLPQDLRDALKGRLLTRSVPILFVTADVLFEWRDDSTFAPYLPFVHADHVLSVKMDDRVSVPGCDTAIAPMACYQVIPTDARHVKLKTRGGVPVVLSKRTVTCLTVAGLWRWRQHPETAYRQSYDLLWKQVLELFHVADEQRLCLEVITPIVHENDAESSLFRISGEAVRASKDGRFSLIDADGKFVADFQPGDDWRDAAFMPNRHGVHWFRAETTSAEGELIRSDSVPVLLRKTDRELEGLKDRSGLLARMSELTGGSVLNGDAAPILKQITDRGRDPKSQLKRNPGNWLKEILLCSVLFVLAVAEWFVRQYEKMRIF